MIAPFLLFVDPNSLLRMTRALPRTHFNSSSLIRFLADRELVNSTEPSQDVGERLGLWLKFTDAITLCAAHNESNDGRAGVKSATPAGARVAAREDFERIKRGLVNSIATSCTPGAGQGRMKWPLPKPELPIDLAVSYEPYRRFHLAHQREMELTVRPLRAKVREVLSSVTPTLSKLVALDAAFDGILAERESRLFSMLPGFLQKRFEHLLAEHRQMLLDHGQADDPTLWMMPGEWLAKFCQEVQTVLLAELDVRLQPTQGLIDALSNGIHTQQ